MKKLILFSFFAVGCTPLANFIPKSSDVIICNLSNTSVSVEYTGVDLVVDPKSNCEISERLTSMGTPLKLNNSLCVKPSITLYSFPRVNKSGEPKGAVIVIGANQSFLIVSEVVQKNPVGLSDVDYLLGVVRGINSDSPEIILNKLNVAGIIALKVDSLDSSKNPRQP